MLYSKQNDSVPLEPEQVREVVRAAEAVKPEGREIWFVFVVWNSRLEGGVLDAALFYTPDESTPRLRKGCCVPIGLVAREIRLGDLSPYARSVARGPAIR